MKHHSKKIVAINERSSADARGARLKRVRNLANLSRKDMCNDGTININTYKGWEIGRYGGLPSDGAEKIIVRLKKEGVRCSVEWLLYGSGEPPQLVTSFISISNAKLASGKEEIDDHQLIINELDLFAKHYGNIVYLQIIDDSMSPSYKPSEFVAGVWCHREKIENLIGQDCIIQTSEDQVLVRKLLKGENKEHYNLVCTNLGGSIAPILTNIKVVKAAKIIRHYRYIN